MVGESLGASTELLMSKKKYGKLRYIIKDIRGISSLERSLKAVTVCHLTSE